MKRTASEKSNGRSSAGSARGKKFPLYAVCLDNRGNEVSLQIGKIYRIVAPLPNDPPSMFRVIDEEGEDYLYGKRQFQLIDVPAKVKRAVSQAAAV